MRGEPRIVIIGAGPTGLGAAWRLARLGYKSWLIIDAAEEPGGLAASVMDDHGFTWDLGGHVLFSHYERFDRLMDDLLGDAWLEHVRESWVWMRERFIPYPLQNNLWRLPPEDVLACLDGLLAADGEHDRHHAPRTFSDWILQTFGRGLAETFMFPYNRKVWAYDPSTLDVGWMGDRVAVVDLRRVLQSLVLQKDDVTWGPNARFRYPLCGGTGAIWRALHARLPADRVRFGGQVTHLASREHWLRLADGSILPYDCLLSTQPIDCLLRSIVDRPDLAARADGFVHSSTNLVGVGLDGPVPEALATKCWIYFPEPHVPFYRVTIFSNYSPNNVSKPGCQWSLLAEVSESPERPVDGEDLPHDVIRGLRAVRLLPDAARIVSCWHRRLEYGYPTPFLGRDVLLQTIDPELCGLGMWSRGRFGAWKYEVANQDHCFMQGVEAIDHILFGAEETTYRFPAVVNAGKRPDWSPVARLE
jgi:protoporphyrinogen oxidase